MGEAALLEKGGFPQAPIFPKKNAKLGVSLPAGSDQRAPPSGHPQAFEKA